MKGGFEPVSTREDAVGKAVVASAYAVHRALGPGLLEAVYEVCFCHELNKRGQAVERQVVVPIHYDGINFDQGFRIDVLVEGSVVCELKAVETMNPVFEAQLLTYLRLTHHRLGYLINFNTPLIKNGIRRFVL